jgi:hypothetical protein
MPTVTSADGTSIVFDQTGDGEPLVLVDPALHWRDNSAFDGLVPLLSPHFCVHRYDRRGRGNSSDTLPYAPDREVDDLAAIIAHAGGAAFVYGFSSGALLALRAAALGIPITRLAVLEPPLPDELSDQPDPLTGELAELIAAGGNADAVEHFNRSIGVPAEYIDEMRDTPQWAKLEAVAHTLVYDCKIADATTADLLRAVTVRTLVIDSEGSTDNLTGWAATVAARLPNATHISLPGEWHSVADDVLATELVKFFGS